MEKIKSNEQFSGIYRSSDDIENFCLRITLKKIYSIIRVPKFESTQTSFEDQQSTTDFEEVLSVNWQQKVFSKTEKAFYSQKENCTTDLAKRYHQIIKDSRGNDSNNLLFTYIDQDNYEPADKFGSQNITRPKIKRNPSRSFLQANEKNRSLFLDHNQANDSKEFETEKDFVKMFVMADLDPSTLLVSIKYRKSDGLLIIFPDFNDLSNGYYLEIDQNSKQMFVYFIENLSLSSNNVTNQRVLKVEMNKLHKETNELIQKLSVSRNENFELPKFGRVVIMLEIIKGLNFEFDNIHVRFKFEIPKWLKVIEGSLSASTHSSFRKGECWNFGYCHSLVLDFDDEFVLSKSEVEILNLTFELISIDPLLGRERREGITSIKIPLTTPLNENYYTLTCFRDIQGNSKLTDFFERFFLGGIHKILDKTLMSSPIDKVVNYYGNQTISTGELCIKIQKIEQLRSSKRSKSHFETIDKIINSYHEAKAQLEK
ncbi:CLUMA_CG009182, isoform A [Clunio marinus]|uniref:CLUMA_CG009182, isoform A n=1 Tax=Clunio marinus TaxID=568069 RepID=A0A1J1I601_9DIPT|nr:CLUMA_CG009182, isoform A [Clunio marinus]